MIVQLSCDHRMTLRTKIIDMIERSIISFIAFLLMYYSFLWLIVSNIATIASICNPLLDIILYVVFSYCVYKLPRWLTLDQLETNNVRGTNERKYNHIDLINSIDIIDTFGLVLIECLTLVTFITNERYRVDANTHTFIQVIISGIVGIYLKSTWCCAIFVFGGIDSITRYLEHNEYHLVKYSFGEEMICPNIVLVAGFVTLIGLFLKNSSKYSSALSTSALWIGPFVMFSSLVVSSWHQNESLMISVISMVLLGLGILFVGKLFKIFQFSIMSRGFLFIFLLIKYYNLIPNNATNTVWGIWGFVLGLIVYMYERY